MTPLVENTHKDRARSGLSNSLALFVALLVLLVTLLPACVFSSSRDSGPRQSDDSPAKRTDRSEDEGKGGNDSSDSRSVDSSNDPGKSDVGEVRRIPLEDFNPADSTRAIQQALDDGADTVVIPYTARPWIVRPLFLRSHTRLVFEPGVILEAKRGEYRGKHDSVLLAKNVRDVQIIGYGATIRMHRDDYKGAGYEKAEWRHGICLKGAVDVEVHGIRVEESGGDGLYIGPTWDSLRNNCRNVVVTDCHFDRNYRQGITVVAGINIKIENCLMTGTAGTAPQAGIDLEPSHPKDSMEAILVRNCVAEGNAGSGLLANLTRLSNKSRPVAIRVENFLVRDSVQPGIRAILREDFGAEGFVDFVNCTVEDTQYAGAVVIWDPGTGIDLSFKDCRWSNVARRANEPPMFFDFPCKVPGKRGCTISFENFHVYDDKDRDLVILKDPNQARLDNLSGEITAFGSRPRIRAFNAMPKLQLKRGNR